MNYEDFKRELVETLPDYLPAKYKSWTILSKEVTKVNGFREAIHILSDGECGASPNLYLDELYAYYEQCESMERVCQRAASLFVAGLDYAVHLAVSHISEIPQNRIIFVLIAQNGNQRLLEQVPHRLTLDLAVIYRVVLESSTGELNSAIVTWDMAEEMGLTEMQLYDLALVNTPKIMGMEIRRAEGFPFMVTNKLCISGASTMLYPGLLAQLSEELDRDLIILPSSLQEFFVVPDVGQDIKEMNHFVKVANETVVAPEEILADHVYYYHRATDQVCIPDWE